MLWGAGRLLFRAFQLLRARAPRPALLASRRLALAALGIVLLGGGAPVQIAGGPAAAVRPRLDPGTGPGFFAFGRPVESLGERAESAAVPRVRPTATPEKRYALLVGINHAPGARQLQGAVADALNVKMALRAYGFPQENVTTLLDGEATRGAILSGLDSLAARTPADGVAVFVVAAHSRVKGGVNQLLAADGQRISSTEIASRLQKLRAKAWIGLPTCYAEGYALPGIVGHNRIATFASSGDRPSYELGRAGSYLILNMVKRAMIEAAAPTSVETSFRWAERSLEKNAPNRVPLMSDGVDGDLVLGNVTWSRPRAARTAPGRRAPSGGSSGGSSDGSAVAADGGTQSKGSGPSEPERTPPPRRYVQVCGDAARFNCHN